MLQRSGDVNTRNISYLCYQPAVIRVSQRGDKQGRNLCRSWAGDLPSICYSCAQVLRDLTNINGINGGEAEVA